jgi:citrate synthase
MPRKAELHFDGRVIPLDLVEGSEGERAVDIRKLRDDTGLITLDPGYANTGSCESAITFIDGEQGILRYRGYDIADLAEHCSFLEVAYLLIEGQLPDRKQLDTFSGSIRYHSMLHEDFRQFYRVLPKDAHPMAACSAVVGALATFYPDSLDPRNPRQVEVSVHRLIAKLPTIAAYAYKHSIGQPFMYPDNRLSYVGNVLRLLFATPCEPYEVDPVVEKAIDLLLILHADHEQNCSTSTVRLVGSSFANLFAAISAGINALWGPRHGGANQEVIEMLQAIAAEGISGREFVERAKSKDDTSRLMGFGHRVYKNFDPRAHHQEGLLRRAGAARHPQQAARDRGRARGARAQGRVLHRAQALPERRLLLGRDLQRDRYPAHHVHADVRDRPPAWLDRPVARDARAAPQDRPPAPDLHWRARAEGAEDRGAVAHGSRGAFPLRAIACYTTGRYTAGRVWLGERVALRLVRDARALGLGALDAGEVLARLLALGRERFGDRAGVVRLEAHAGGELIGSTRPLGPEPEGWRAITAAVVHPGRGPAPGAKRAGVAELAQARAAAESAGADEALLFDAAGRLVEGARTNLVLAHADGRWLTPPAERGAVRGVALEAALAAGLAIAEHDLSRADCAAAHEIVATNAVRGARPILALDGARVGGGRAGPLAAALAAALATG